MSNADPEQQPANSSGMRFAVKVEQLRPGEVMPVQIDGEWYGICNEGGRFHAFENACPHAGAALGYGIVRAGCIICRRHRWPWDLQTGLTDSKMPWLRLKCYRCEVREGEVYVDTSALISE